jgi:hypothetical protein
VLAAGAAGVELASSSSQQVLLAALAGLAAATGRGKMERVSMCQYLAAEAASPRGVVPLGRRLLAVALLVWAVHQAAGTLVLTELVLAAVAVVASCSRQQPGLLITVAACGKGVRGRAGPAAALQQLAGAAAEASALLLSGH